MSMTGDFLITKEFLKTLSPCTGGYRWFCETYPDGGKYQEILDKLCELDRFDDACWLIDEVGETVDVLEIDSIYDKGKSICFAGTIIARKNLVLKNIKAGWSIKADGYIETGEDFGVYAGLRMRISDMKILGYIKAQEKPENLMCGYWEEN